MAFDLAKDWPVYLLLGGVLYFFGYVIIKGNMPEKKDKGGEDNKDTKNKK